MQTFCNISFTCLVTVTEFGIGFSPMLFILTGWIIFGRFADSAFGTRSDGFNLGVVIRFINSLALRSCRHFLGWFAFWNFVFHSALGTFGRRCFKQIRFISAEYLIIRPWFEEKNNCDSQYFTCFVVGNRFSVGFLLAIVVAGRRISRQYAHSAFRAWLWATIARYSFNFRVFVRFADGFFTQGRRAFLRRSTLSSFVHSTFRALGKVGLWENNNTCPLV